MFEEEEEEEPSSSIIRKIDTRTRTVNIELTCTHNQATPTRPAGLDFTELVQSVSKLSPLVKQA